VSHLPTYSNKKARPGVLNTFGMQIRFNWQRSTKNRTAWFTCVVETKVPGTRVTFLEVETNAKG
jgi:hypothetical protein